MYFPGKKKNRLYIFRESRHACFTTPLHAARRAGSSRPCGAAAGGQAAAAAAGILPALLSPSPAAPGSPAPPAAGGRSSGPPGAPDGAVWSGCGGDEPVPGQTQSFSGAGRAGLASPRRVSPPPSWTSEGGSGATSALRIAAASARPAAAGRLAGGSSASPPPRYFPLSRQSRGAPSPICMARPALGRGSRRGPAIPPPPIAEAPRKEPPAGKAPAPPCRAFPRRAGIREEKKHIYRIGIFFSLNSTSS